MYKQLNAAEGHIYDMNFKICVTLTSNVRVCDPLFFQGQSNGCDKSGDRMGSNFREIWFPRMKFLYIQHQHSKNEFSELPERQYYQKIAQKRSIHHPAFILIALSKSSTKTKHGEDCQRKTKEH